MNPRTALQACVPVAAIVVALSATRCGGDQPTPCGMASGLAIARYTMKSGPTDMTPGACNAVLAQGSLTLPPTGTPLPVLGEQVSTEEYLPDQADSVATKTEHRSLAIEPTWLYARIQDAELDATQDPALKAQQADFASYPFTAKNPQPALPPADPTNVHRPYAWGFFDTLLPDTDGVCTATLNASDLVYPDIPAHTWNSYSYNNPPQPPDATPVTLADQPATHVRYEWKNVKVIVHEASVGQQLFADLTITRDDCQAQYKVALLSPLTSCANTDSNGNVFADESICSAAAVPNVPNPTIGQLYGSGLPDGVPVACQDMNASPGGAADGGGAGGGASPDWECVPTKTSP